MQHIVIFDIGKTNKKCFVFDEDYHVVYEKSEHLLEAKDEVGFPCEDVHLLVKWLKSSLLEVMQMPDFQVNAVNISAYGASFVYLDEKGEILTPLYNYLKPYPAQLQQDFFEKYGGETKLANETASPVLGSLNAGLQLYRIKYEQPDIFNRIKYALHLPQFLSYVMGGELFSEITSIGCHTMLWDFEKNGYHEWVIMEGISEKFPTLQQSTLTSHQSPKVGIGLHDSSAALIPYLPSFSEPFVLLSTGTWNIAMNPFNDNPLTGNELEQDCLCYLSYQGKPVKASRLFAGHEYEVAIRDLGLAGVSILRFEDAKKLGLVGNKYLEFLKQLVEKQVVALNLVLTSEISKIFVDGGFSKNEIFMTLLAEALPGLAVYAATVAQASALGAAVAVHDIWNSKPLPTNLVGLKKYGTI